jgi:hypothetical protein
MNDPADSFDAILDLDARHDELLRQLEELDHRVEKVLADCLPACDASRGRLESPVRPSPATLEIIPLEPPAAAA